MEEKKASQPPHSGNESSGSVTWRDDTLCHGMSGSPLLPGTTGKVISERSPGSPGISSDLQLSVVYV
eukprot:1096368-Amorphochlora_amoeboformis.AAC.1